MVSGVSRRSGAQREIPRRHEEGARVKEDIQLTYELWWGEGEISENGRAGKTCTPTIGQ